MKNAQKNVVGDFEVSLENAQLKYIYDKYGVKVRLVMSWKWGPGADFMQRVAKFMIP